MRSARVLEPADGRTPQLDTVRDAEAPADVKALLARCAAGEPVDRTVLVAELERMLRLVTATDAGFDRAVLLIRRRSPLALRSDVVRDVYTLPDGSALVSTSWIRSAEARIADWLEGEAHAARAEHDDPRGVPCFRAAQLEIARAAASYEDALYLLGDSVRFL